MNKLQGFLELRKTNLPTIPWKKYEESTVLDENILWTIRTAVKTGDDLNLPRKVGVDSIEAREFAQKLLKSLNSDDLVIYYPYFIATKSGVLEVAENKTVIEAVKDDLWNLVTYNKKNVTAIFEEEDMRFIGEEDFLTPEEMLQLIRYSLIVKKKYSNILFSGKSLFLEWSFAQKSDINKTPQGDVNLLFYEIRSVD